LSELSSKYEAKLNVSTTLQALSARLTSDVEEMKVEIKSLRQWIPSLVTNLEYYKKKHTDLEAQMSDLQPL
jgi:cell division protein FtsB